MMKLISIHLIAILSLCSPLLAQDQLRLVLPQNVFIPSENVPYGVIMDEALMVDDLYPITHVTLYSGSGNVVFSHQQRSTQPAEISSFALPEYLVGGTYILSVALLSKDLIEVSEESSLTLHILSKDVDKYLKFNGDENLSNTSSQSIHTREEVCFDEHLSDNGFNYIVDSDFRLFFSGNHSKSNGAITLQAKVAYNVELPNKNKFPALLDVDQRYAYPIKSSGIVEFGDEEMDRKIQLIDYLNGTVEQRIDLIPHKHTWDPSSLMEVALTPKEVARLLQKVEQRESINRIFQSNEKHELKLKTVSSITNFDTEYDLSEDYLQFESLELFFKEVAQPVSIRTKKDTIRLRILSGDTKQWFQDSPAVLIDGVLQESLSSMWNLNYSDCSKIRLYRKLETYRYAFGPLGRNGVLEIITKSGKSNKSLKIPGLFPNDTYTVKPIDVEASEPTFRPIQHFSSIPANTSCHFHSDDIGQFIYFEVGLISSYNASYLVE